jgi:hypothetical protein
MSNLHRRLDVIANALPKGSDDIDLSQLTIEQLRHLAAGEPIPPELLTDEASKAMEQINKLTNNKAGTR